MMDKKSMAVGAVVISAVAVVGGLVWSAEKDKIKEKGDDSTQVAAIVSKITVDQASKVALDNFPGKVIEADLEKKLERMVWEIDVQTAEQGVMVVQVDADSGSVVTTGEKIAEERETKQ